MYFLDWPALIQQVSVQRLKLRLIIRIVADLVQLRLATGRLLDLNVCLLTRKLQTVLIGGTAHPLHAGRSLFSLIL